MSFGNAHPDLVGVRCDNSSANHPECSGYDEAVGGYVDWPNEHYVAPKAVRGPQGDRLKVMAARTAAAPRTEPLEGFPAAEEASARAATRWDEKQVALVDAAIQAVAKAHSGGREFTSDAIWAELDGAVPVTKGLTARLMKAARQRIIDNTGKTEKSERGGHHDHGQRLTVWYSLL